MASPELLRNAPIVEAILDVRVSTRRDFDVKDFVALSDALRSRLPVREERRSFEFRTQIQPGIASEAQATDLGVQGYFFKSLDGLDVAQFRVDGFTLNRLKPYQSWEKWFPLFQTMWRHYVDVARPDSVTRIAARCINHIPLPGRDALGRFMRTPPVIPSKLPDLMSTFVTSIALLRTHDPELGLNLTQALESNVEGGPRLIVDVDAFRTGNMRPAEILDCFDELRLLRDQAFFESITDEAKDLFR